MCGQRRGQARRVRSGRAPASTASASTGSASTAVSLNGSQPERRQPQRGHLNGVSLTGTSISADLDRRASALGRGSRGLDLERHRVERREREAADRQRDAGHGAQCRPVVLRRVVTSTATGLERRCAASTPSASRSSRSAVAGVWSATADDSATYRPEHDPVHVRVPRQDRSPSASSSATRRSRATRTSSPSCVRLLRADYLRHRRAEHGRRHPAQPLRQRRRPVRHRGHGSPEAEWTPTGAQLRQLRTMRDTSSLTGARNPGACITNSSHDVRNSFAQRRCPDRRAADRNRS